jgi:predicted ribosomally synthesized peptide with SipW-like signal peptide
MKKILASLAMITAVAAALAGATSSYFSDVETSNNNTFVAGSIDLEVGNNSYYNGVAQALWPAGTSWSLDDLTGQLFFNFNDVKPGDYGQDTISLLVHDNPSWVCANVTITGAAENDVVEPETSDGDNTAVGTWDGELDNALNFFFWADVDGDGVYDAGETTLMSGPVSALPQGTGNVGYTYPIVDATHNVFGTVGTAFAPETVGYIAKVWCFGNLTVDPATAPGYTCDGTLVNNVAQTDSVTGNVSFYAVQERHNAGFACSSWNPNAVIN